MAIALHHPEDGYYRRNVRTIGRRGDFTTVPQLAPALGEALGRWLRAEAGRRGWTRFDVIECGPGSGALSAAVRKSFGWLGRRKVRLHLVETSQPLRAQQQRRVRGRWHATIGEALAACGGRALIFHNEFFDAFPCRVFRREGGGWTELHLRVAGGKLAETFLPVAPPRPDAEVFGHPWPEGQRVEVFASVRDWMRGLSDLWHEGAMLAIDYGGTARSIYHRRPGGTLRAYRNHQRLEGDAVYEWPGRQDITADVNFEDLRRWAAALGWTAGAEESLARWVPSAPAAGAFRCLQVARS
jgi:SAM-dependent MidA family methyltransferase